jgi:hypothetical protein
VSVGTQIPLLVEMTLSTCGSKKFQIDCLGTTSALVPPTRVSRWFTTGWLIENTTGG